QPWALRLDFATEVQLLRIIQEALNNVRKHAKASRVKVSIQSTAGETRVCVADDGQGFDMDASLPGKNHYGLDIMRERANEAGGEFRIESKPGEGTTVTVKFSLRRVETNEDIVGG
ncbi:MAG TPA: ATP-binding protein, partial [Patescibacteria group bacterium]|nr:ATP-binding protein [Patescibacteria group bacterium]